jgi:hypothetical protein
MEVSNVNVVLTRRPVLLWGLGLLLTLLGSALPVIERLLEATSLTGLGLAWIVSALALIFVDGSMRLAMRRHAAHGSRPMSRGCSTRPAS